MLKYSIAFLLIIKITMSFGQKIPSDKITIYQVFTRLLTNPTHKNKFNGSLSENGSTKFNDINDNVLKSIKDLGSSHIWYTGVIEHASLEPISSIKFKGDHPLVVKGKAGSPYAIKDYYDVNPYLATNPKSRMQEFQDLIQRSHKAKLKVIIDFVPNHLARQYASDVKPKGSADFGSKDDVNVGFSPNNNFYYVPGKSLALDSNIKPLIENKTAYTEIPAKVTGNDVFSEKTNINDWYETVKLNYGLDYLNGRSKHFDPIPDTWLKMRDILSYWTKKGVDGFRCDMAEMVPVEFWAWVIPEIKKVNPGVIFIAEIYNPAEYRNYIFTGKFDYLYDKVGLYDALRRLIEGHGSTADITKVWQNESGEFSNKMLRFLENHDEQRIASKFFGNEAKAAFPAMMLSATLHGGPVMLYFGQEFGVKAEGAEGFAGDDGRTTIFDFWAVKELQNWIRGGFTAKNLNKLEKETYTFYKKLFNFASKDEVIKNGKFYDLQYLNTHESYRQNTSYSYLRYTDNKMYLFVYNFNKNTNLDTEVVLPEDLISKYNFARNLNKPTNNFQITDNKINANLKPNSFIILEMK